MIQNHIDKLKALTDVLAGQGPNSVELRGFEPHTSPGHIDHLESDQ
jgi:hypothetical protein